jgi:hypothetical protein
VSPVYLLLSIVVAVVVYVVCLWYLGEVKDKEKNTVLQVWYRLAGKEAPTNSGSQQ